MTSEQDTAKKTMAVTDVNRPVFRDKVKEGRETCFVEYYPADGNAPFASLQVIFPAETPKDDIVKAIAEREILTWLNRYPVPIMVSAFDMTGSLIHFADRNACAHLIGFMDLKTGIVRSEWRLLKENELPAEQTTYERLQKIYHDLPFRYRYDVKKLAIKKWKITARILNTFVLFIVAIPCLIEIVSLGVNLIGYILSGISITAGLFKIAKKMGWIKPSKRQQEEDDKKRKMEHYYYHCQLNPDAFERLKCENFRRESIKETQEEARKLGVKIENMP